VSFDPDRYPISVHGRAEEPPRHEDVLSASGLGNDESVPTPRDIDDPGDDLEAPGERIPALALTEHLPVPFHRPQATPEAAVGVTVNLELAS
jgi:hypothetical protein